MDMARCVGSCKEGCGLMVETNNGIPMHDSGERQSFDTGCQRDTQTGKTRPDLIASFALLRLARVYEQGAQKYNDNNWIKGMPYSRVLSSVWRHIIKWKFRKMLGLKQNEDHLMQAAWNLFTLAEYELIHPELDDIQDIYKSLFKDEKAAEKAMKVIEEYLGNILDA